jgi:hypothetical protein
MKNLFLPIIIAFAFVVGLNAKTQYPFPRGENLTGIVLSNDVDDTVGPLLTIDEIKANVNLTDEQRVTVDSILTDASTKLQDVTDPGDAGQQSKTQIINDAYSAIRNVLTDDQKTEFDALVAQKKSDSNKGNN